MAGKASIPYRTEIASLLRLAAPLFIAQLAQMGTGVVDTIMAGHYSADDLAAIAIGYNIWLPIYLFGLGVMLAVASIVAQDFGAGRLQRVRDSLPQSLWLSLAVGLLSLPLCYNAGPVLELLQLDAETQAKSLGYLQAVAFGLPGAALFQSLRCHIQGIGVIRPFALASVLGFFANIPLNYAFIYGEWGIPEMGAAGCGWATAISMWLGPVLLAFYIARAESLRPFLPLLRPVAPQRAALGDMFRLGWPIGLTFFLEVGVFSLIGLGIATLGNVAMASHQIAFNVYDLVYMPLISIGTAMSTRIGHAIGAGDKPGVILAVRCGAMLTLSMAAAITLLLWLAPHLITGLYTTDAGIHQLAATLVRMAAMFIMLDATYITASFSLRAFKDNRFPFVVMCIAYWGLALPLGYYLGLVRADNAVAGTVGFWWSMIAGITVASALVLMRLRRILRAPLPRAEAVRR